jgi:hypothetical protein
MSAPGWAFFKIALIVTGEGEERFLPDLFQSLMSEGHCVFAVARRVQQLSPIASEKRVARMVGRGSPLASRDEEIGLLARRCLQDFDFVVLVDDLESDRRARVRDVYGRYRQAMDLMLDPIGLGARASIHFLVNMIEAYYFADASAINEVLGTTLANHEGDVEEIRHPKNYLKAIHSGFDEVKHGEKIVKRLDVPHVLSRPETCKSLRTLFGWCSKAIGRPRDGVYRLDDGEYNEVTRPQLDALP